MMNKTDQQNNSKFHIEHWQKITLILIGYDIFAICSSYALALWLRFDCKFSEIPTEYLAVMLKTVGFYAVFCILLFMRLRLYRTIWRFANYDEMIRVMLATGVGVFLYTTLTSLFVYRMPIFYYVIGAIFQFISTLGIRFAYRVVLILRANINRNSSDEKNVMIIGAGTAGHMILRDIRTSRLKEKVCCFIDDNPNKTGRYIDGVLVVGGRDHILEASETYEIEKIYIAIPSATAENKRDILNICNLTSCQLMNLPGYYSMMHGKVHVDQMKQVVIEDLLGRDPIVTNMKPVYEQISGKTILVTGGGGSIGSELCRQIAAHGPKQLIIFDIYENNAYDIQLELKETYPNLNLVTLIGSVRDSRRIFQVFEQYHPDIVYHAAAHKHVPLMEDSPCEAVKNNAIGTYKTAFAAMAHGCQRFVLISTDKAVNPTNQMGATKRICEMICQAFDQKIREGKAAEIPQLFTHEKQVIGPEVEKRLKEAKTEFVAVRFGNVLGSNGSVIPIFKKQIEKGGPVTVTHPDIIRYFMTIPEAVSLVLTAGTFAKGGQIFVLDMGEPVKIDTLARNLIRKSGLKPDVDIRIIYTGLRPGEKLFEEKLMAEEGLQKTDNDLIHIGCPIPFDVDIFLNQLSELMDAAYKNKDNIRVLMQEIVSTYHPVL